jgi:ubiquinone/menaquinone biosynthesis C-methylase UbiE
MSFYEERVLPHVINLAMTTAGITDERRRCLEPVGGAVLEIGFGTGLNLPYYPAAVTRVVGVDPSRKSADLARKRIAASPFPVEVIGLSAEKLPVADASFDTIVSTFTLCTIPDVANALAEMRRALSPGGRLHFVEHGQAADPDVVRWQQRLNGLQRKVFGGCHLNRRISSLIERAGFVIETLENDYMKGAPKFGGYLYRGIARRSEA